MSSRVLTKRVDAGQLNNLPQHPDVSDIRNFYLENSRLEDERFIGKWIDDSPELVLWIHATAGLGKSTLARYVGEKLLLADRLAASVFFERILKPKDQAPGTIVDLIAGDLGRAHPKAGSSVNDATGRYKSSSANLQLKLQECIRGPLRCLKYSYPLVVILDGIDVWKAHRIFFEALASLNAECRSIKFIVLSRSIPDTAAFPTLSIRCYPLPPVSTNVMEQYVSSRFEKIDWQGDEKPPTYEVTRLAKKANGVFIWVGTTCALLEDSLGGPPRQRLDQILQSQVSIGDSEDLKALYSSAMNLSFPSTSDRSNATKYLHITFALKEALPTTDFARLVQMPRPTVERIRAGLYTLPSRKPVNGDDMVYPALSLFHLSVIEYFQRKDDSHESIQPLVGHEMLAQACLEILPRTVPSRLHPIPIQLKELRSYALRFWVIHLTEGFDCVTMRDRTSHGVQLILRSLQEAGIALLKQWASVLLQDVFGLSASKSIKDQYEGGEEALLMWDVACALDASWESEDTEYSESAIPLQIACLEVAVCFQEGNLKYWHDLGNAHMVAAKHNIAPSVSFKKAIFAHGLAVDLSDEQDKAGIDRKDLGKATLLASLAHSMISTADYEGNVELLEKATRHLRKALRLHPEQHPDRYITMNLLANSLHSWWLATLDLQHLDDSIAVYHQVLELLPEHHTRRAVVQSDLARALCKRFEATHSTDMEMAAIDLDRSISLGEEALKTPDGKDPHQLLTLLNLATCLRYRSYHIRDKAVDMNMKDWDNAIQRHREAICLTPPGHPLREQSLPNLLVCLYEHFKESGDPDKLKELVTYKEETIALLPPGHPHRLICLLQLLQAHRQLYKISSLVGDVNAAIQLAREVVRAIPDHQLVERALEMVALANDLQSRLWQEESDAKNDAIAAVDMCREALLLCPEGPSHFHCSWALAKSLGISCVFTGNVEELQEAVAIATSALSRCPASNDRLRMMIIDALHDCQQTAHWFLRQPGMFVLYYCTYL